MDAEFETFAVDVIGKRLEALTIGGRREAIHGGLQAAKIIHGKFGAGAIAMRFRIRLRPLDVDHDVLPAMLLQILRHVIGIGFHFGFGDAGAERIPTIPTHGRRGGQQVLRVSRERE